MLSHSTNQPRVHTVSSAHSCANVSSVVDFVQKKVRRLKLQGQNLPKSASLRHSEKIFFMADPKTKQPKIKQKTINWTIFIYFQENRLPRKIIYLPKDALLFWENHDFFFLL